MARKFEELQSRMLADLRIRATAVMQAGLMGLGYRDAPRFSFFSPGRT